MIARGFKPVAWVAAVGAAALGCYMLSLQVAAERAELARLERRSSPTQQQIRSLQTELGTRGRLQQLEQWNADVLALSAPVAGQFLAGECQPRPLRHPASRRSTSAAEVRMASAEAAPAAGAGASPRRLAPRRGAPSPAAAAAPRRRCAPADRRSAPACTPSAAAAPAAAGRASRRRRGRGRPPRHAAASGAAPAASATPRSPAATPSRPAARRRRAGAAGTPPRRAGRGSSLLDDRTLRELGADARAERGGSSAQLMATLAAQIDRPAPPGEQAARARRSPITG